jgi:NAD(P)H-dependent flavin oxidoreductase YrpB (nitropropane dioxygenase family)
MTLQTPACDLFGVEFPVFSAGMGIGAGAALAAAVSNAGGCGVIGGQTAELTMDCGTKSNRCGHCPRNHLESICCPRWLVKE